MNCDVLQKLFQQTFESDFKKCLKFMGNIAVFEQKIKS